MSKKIVTLLVLFFLSVPAIFAVQTYSFQDRQKYILDFYSTAYPDTIYYWGDDDIKTAMGFALARLETKKDTKRALDMIERMQSLDFDMFDRHQNIDAYFRFSNFYSSELKDKIKKRMTETDYFGNGSTENHKLMFKTAGYLTALAFPDWCDARKTMQHCRAELIEMMDATVKYGIKEFDSPTYGTFYITCLLSLYDHTKDAEFKNKVRMVLEWHLLNFAPEWLNGYFISSSLREYFFTCSPRLESPYPIIGWLLFGGDEKPFLEQNFRNGALTVNEGFFSVLAAISSYRLPQIIEDIATDRINAYVHLESHDMEPNAQLNYPWGFKKYTYINKHYGLASHYDGTSLGWAGNMRRWKLVWESEAPASTMFFTHPCPYDHAEASLIGATPREQVLQHNGTLLAMYKIESGEPFPYVTGGFPIEAVKCIKEDASGWIFCDGGSVLFGIKFTHPYEWIVNRDFKGVAYKMLQCKERSTGVVVETCLPEEYAAGGRDTALDLFAKDILAKTSFTYEMENVEYRQINYHSLKGDNLKLVFNYGRFVNDTKIDYEKWPLISDPWMEQAIDGRFLTLCHGNHTRVYDFQNWTIVEN